MVLKGVHKLMLKCINKLQYMTNARYFVHTISKIDMEVSHTLLLYKMSQPKMINSNKENTNFERQAYCVLLSKQYYKKILQIHIKLIHVWSEIKMPIFFWSSC